MSAKISYKGIRNAPDWAKRAAKIYAESYRQEGRNRTNVDCELRPLADGRYQLVIFRGLKLWMPSIEADPKPGSLQAQLENGVIR